VVISSTTHTDVKLSSQQPVGLFELRDKSQTQAINKLFVDEVKFPGLKEV
jgi:hypothetical protein